jgi:hypothetical protein
MYVLFVFVILSEHIIKLSSVLYSSLHTQSTKIQGQCIVVMLHYLTYLQRVLVQETQHYEAAVIHVTRAKMCTLSVREDPRTKCVIIFSRISAYDNPLLMSEFK